MVLMVRDSPDLRVMLAALRDADAETKKAIRRESARFAPQLESAIRARARGSVQQRIAASAKVTTTAKGLVAKVGASGKLSSGVKLGEVTRPYEFGTTRQNVKKKGIHARSPRGLSYFYDRRTMRQIPPRNEQGHFVYAALADMTPELVSRYVRVVARIVSGAPDA